MRVLFTGGSGKAGKHVVAYLAAQGHRVVNVDRVPLNHPGRWMLRLIHITPDPQKTWVFSTQFYTHTLWVKP